MKLTDFSLELYGCDKEKLSDKEYIKKFLFDLPSQIGMKKVDNPVVISGVSDSGITLGGFVILKESHVAIHTWPDKQYAYVCILSCKPFDKSKATDLIVESFYAQKYRRLKSKIYQF